MVFRSSFVFYFFICYFGGADACTLFFFSLLSFPGWPAGALATGAGAIKTVAERDIFGGLANAPYPFHHLIIILSSHHPLISSSPPPLLPSPPPFYLLLLFYKKMFDFIRLDPCYHLSCDTTANIAQDVLEDMSKGAAYVVQKLATNSNLREFLFGARK